MKAEELVARLIDNVRAFVQPAIDGLAAQVQEALASLRQEVDAEGAARLSRALNGLPDRSAIEALEARIAAIEQSPPRAGRDGDNAYELAVANGLFDGDVDEWLDSLKGEPGPAPTPEALRSAVAEHLAAHPIPVPKDGRSVTAEDVRPLLDAAFAAWALEAERRAGELVQRALDRLAAREATLAELEAGVERRVAELGAKALERLAEQEEEIRELAGAVETQHARLVADVERRIGSLGAAALERLAAREAELGRFEADVERRCAEALERAYDRTPKPRDGIDGRDALEVEDLAVELDEETRTLTIRGERAGAQVVIGSCRIPYPVDRGVYVEGRDYELGHGVTFGGSWWIAQKDAPAGKPGTSPDWRLAVRQGRNARTRPPADG